MGLNGIRGVFGTLVSIILALSMVLTGCSSSSQSSGNANAGGGSKEVSKDANTSAPTNQKVIGFSQGWSGITWLRIMRKEVEDEAKKQGVKLQVSDGANKPEKQLADIEDFIAKKVDALIISTYQAQAIAPGVQKALAANIPVIVISSDIPGVEPTVHLGSNARDTGKAAGEYLAKVLNGKGKIIQITGQEGSVVNKDRGLGFEDVLKNNPGLVRVAKQAADYDRNKAINVMEDLLQVNKDINAVYAHNDEMAMGAIQVLKQKGYKLYPQDPKGVIVIGVDGLEEPNLKAIADGELAASFRYITFGKEAVQAAMDIINGKKVEKNIILPTPLVTKDTVSQYLSK